MLSGLASVLNDFRRGAVGTLLVFASVLGTPHAVFAESGSAAGVAPDAEGQAETVAPSTSPSTPPPAREPIDSVAVPASPAAVDKVPGTGALGRWLGLPADSAWRLGGVWVGNGTTQLGGGVSTAGVAGLAQQFLLDLQLDLDRSLGWPGASVWVQGLQVNANTTAFTASGSLQGANSLVAPPPLDRTELYSYAFSQFLFDDQVRLLVGKLAPSNDFANVVIPVSERFGSTYWVPAISSLTYTPLYAMPTLLGRLPGYPNSALGASLLVQPNALQRQAYIKVGVFDGRGGIGVDPSVQTGLSMPSLAGPLFSIGEIGGSWRLGATGKPGAASFGLWHQGGPLGCGDGRGACSESSAAGGYLLSHQRLVNFRYPHDHSGISAFFQAGWSPSVTNFFTTSIGGGLTMFAPLRSRPLDSYGMGLSWARINEQGPFASTSNNTELMVQVYAQIHLVSNLYLTPSLTVLPVVGQRNATGPSTSALLQLVALF